MKKASIINYEIVNAEEKWKGIANVVLGSNKPEHQIARSSFEK